MRRMWVLVAMVSVLGVGLVSAASPSASARDWTYDPSEFDAGNIISDELFYDGRAMSASEVQNFLNGQVRTCDSGSPEPCLKDYTLSTKARAATDRCNALPASSNKTAAQHIADVGRACGISQKVLLVTLQKEQALVTSTAPTARRYQIATGYGCPDTAPCETAYYGFDNQIYLSASQFKRYQLNPGNYRFRAGGTYNIGYSPTASCGTRRVTIENAATAGLYNYTPYTPNAAALAAYPGTAACGAYGNRNFWALWNIWFWGDETPGMVVRTAGASHWWLTQGNSRWRISPNDSIGRSDVQHWDDVEVVDPSYVNSFTNRGDYTGLVRATGGTPFIIDNGQRYTISGGCSQASDWGLSCSGVPVLEWDDIALFDFAGNAGPNVRLGNGHRWVLEDGTKRRVVGAESLDWAGISTTPQIDLKRNVLLASVDEGAPIAAPGVIYTALDRRKWYVSTGDSRVEVPEHIRWQSQLTTWLGWTKADVTLAAVQAVPSAGDFPTLFTRGSSSESYVLTPTGAARITDTGDWPVTFRQAPTAAVDKIPKVSPVGSAPLVIEEAFGGDVSLLADGKRQRTAPAHADTLLRVTQGELAHLTILDDANHQLPLGGAPVMPGVTIQVPGQSAKWFVDDWDTRRLTVFSAMEHTSPGPTVRATQAQVDALDRLPGVVGLGMSCTDGRTVALDGERFKIRGDALRYYTAVLDFPEYSDAACRAVAPAGDQVGRLLLNGSQYWLLQDGYRVPITSSRYQEYRPRMGDATPVDSAFLSFFPTQ